MRTDPDSVGRDSSQMRRPRESTAVPPSRLEEPETTSDVIGDFHDPKGAAVLETSEEEDIEFVGVEIAEMSVRAM